VEGTPAAGARQGGIHHSLLRDLNAAQHEAVTTTEGPLLVLAGAGTGKTRVITYRIAYLLQRGVPPQSILAVTFTNKSAREMRERVAALLGKAGASSAKGLTLSTFHALGARILRGEAGELGLRPSFGIHDGSDQLSLLRGILREIRGAAETADAAGVLAEISRAKNRFQLPEELLDRAQDDREHLVARAYLRYQEQLRSLNCVDFDDLILLPVLLFQSSPEVRDRYRRRFRYILVDEYQDTNGAQYRFTLALTNPERNLCVVGDDDQSIYGFRGAEMEKILGFERDFPGARVVKLEENYRSSGSILALANAVIAANCGRRPKELRSTLGQGVPVDWVRAASAEAEVDCVLRRIQELDLHERLAHEEIAILLRSVVQARPFEEKLRLRRIPYTLIGGQSYFDRKEIRDAIAYWSIANNPRDDLSLLRVINFPRRGFGAQTIEKLDGFARQRGLPLLEALEAAARGEAELPPRARAEGAALVAALRRAGEAFERGDCVQACRALLEEVGYAGALHEIYTDPLTLKARWGAVEELLASVERWQKENRGEPFAAFLGALALDAKDERGNEEKRRGVSLMTLHSAKGLEFPVVFLVGLEEDILPHRKAVAEGERAIEEERRLFYVGITRARRRLVLTGALSRVLWGRSSSRLPSRFLTEIEDRGLFRKEAYDPDAQASEESVKAMLDAFRRKREGQY
jgi:superfamily I DNA/RNA helicase